MARRINMDWYMMKDFEIWFCSDHPPLRIENSPLCYKCEHGVKLKDSVYNCYGCEKWDKTLPYFRSLFQMKLEESRWMFLLGRGGGKNTMFKKLFDCPYYKDKKLDDKEEKC